MVLARMKNADYNVIMAQLLNVVITTFVMYKDIGEMFTFSIYSICCWPKCIKGIPKEDPKDAEDPDKEMKDKAKKALKEDLNKVKDAHQEEIAKLQEGAGQLGQEQADKAKEGVAGIFEKFKEIFGEVYEDEFES